MCVPALSGRQQLWIVSQIAPVQVSAAKTERGWKREQWIPRSSFVLAKYQVKVNHSPVKPGEACLQSGRGQTSHCSQYANWLCYLPHPPPLVDLNLTAAVLALLSLTMMAMGSICIAMSLSKGVPFFLKPASFCFILSGATGTCHRAVHAETGGIMLTVCNLFTLRCPGPSLLAGLPPVCDCSALQRPPGAAAPWTVLVCGLRGLCGGHLGGRGGSLCLARTSFQSLGEVLAAQEQRHLASQRQSS